MTRVTVRWSNPWIISVPLPSRLVVTNIVLFCFLKSTITFSRWSWSKSLWSLAILWKIKINYLHGNPLRSDIAKCRPLCAWSRRKLCSDPEHRPDKDQSGTFFLTSYPPKPLFSSRLLASTAECSPPKSLFGCRISQLPIHSAHSLWKSR